MWDKGREGSLGEQQEAKAGTLEAGSAQVRIKPKGEDFFQLNYGSEELPWDLSHRADPGGADSRTYSQARASFVFSPKIFYLISWWFGKTQNQGLLGKWLWLL